MPYHLLPLLHTEDHNHGIEGDPRAMRLDMKIRTPPGFRSLMRRGKMGANKPPRQVPTHLQRCSVRVRYTKGGSKGKWYSHARYITRKSAAHAEESTVAPKASHLPGFSASDDQVDVAAEIRRWHDERDELFFRVIISPEFGDRMDLKRHVLETMAAAERDIGTKLEWIGVAHYDTDNPHVHLVIRGRRDDGSTLRIDPEYIKEGWRQRASEAATNQLGLRTEHDVFEANRREVSQHRFTSLDRILIKRATVEPDGFHVSLNPANPELRESARARENHLWQRCASLEKMGLSKRVAPGECVIAADFEHSLRQMQRTLDLQKIVLEHGVKASDAKIPFRALKVTEIERIEGRVLVHGQNEVSGSNYTLIESIKGEVLQIPQVGEIARLRKDHGFDPGHFVRIQASVAGDKRAYMVEDYGLAVGLTQDPDFLSRFARRLAKEMPEGFGGWLGDMRNAAVTAVAAMKVVEMPERATEAAKVTVQPERVAQSDDSGPMRLSDYRKTYKPVEKWRTDAKAWRKHLEDKYVEALLPGNDVFGGVDNARSTGARPAAPVRPEYTEQQKRLVEMHEIAAKLFRQNLLDQGSDKAAKARAYLESRGITPEVAAEFGIGLAPDWNQVKQALAGQYSEEEIRASGLVKEVNGGSLGDTFYHRLMIPIQDTDGNVIAFAGRDLSGNPHAPKYLNSETTPIYQKSEVLFNEHRARWLADETGSVVVVEGYFDAIAAHVSGLAAVVPGGTALTTEQAKVAGSMADQVILNFDTDAAGERATRRALEIFASEGVLPQVVSLPSQDGEKTDPAKFVQDHGADGYRQWVDITAKSTLEWLSLEAQKRVSAAASGGAAHAKVDEIKAIVGVLEKVPVSMRPEISRRLSAFLGLSEEQSQGLDQQQENSRKNRI